MITRKVKLAFVGGLDLIYIHKPYRLPHTGLHAYSPQKTQPHTQHMAKKIFFGRATVFLETLVNANNIDPDQVSHSVTSELGQHSLPLSFYGKLY